jgi:hypothetical protein
MRIVRIRRPESPGWTDAECRYEEVYVGTSYFLASERKARRMKTATVRAPTMANVDLAFSSGDVPKRSSRVKAVLGLADDVAGGRLGFGGVIVTGGETGGVRTSAATG